MVSQRGLSGTLRRTNMMARPVAAPSPKASRQPRSIEKRLVVEQHEGQRGADRGAEPVGAVDREVDPAARPRGDELVDGRVDRRVLAADAQAGESGRPKMQRPGEGREHGRRRGRQQRRDEELLAPEAIGQTAEAERADRGADDVEVPLKPISKVLSPRVLLRLQATPDRADDRDLDAVEDSHRAKAEDHQPVRAAPRQPVDTARDPRRDGLAGAGRQYATAFPRRSAGMRRAGPRRRCRGGGRARA